MILRRYGGQFHSVKPNFDPRAMNEVGFQKSGELTVTADEFETRYHPVAEHELRAEAEGSVQHEAESAVLESLRAQLDGLISSLKDNEVLVVLSEPGRDYPKLREKVSNVVTGHENKLHFHRSIDPPLRLGVYASR